MVEITLDDLTVNDLDGTGVFDKLMASVELHIEDQFTKKRITSQDYSQVYLGAMQAVLAQSVQFLTAKAQANLITAQVETEECRKELICNQAAHELTKQALTSNQAQVAAQQIVLMQNQAAHEQSKKELTDAQVLNAGLQGLLITAQTEHEESKKDLTDGQVSKVPSELNILSQQIGKISSEKNLLDQKIFTEQAQILDTVNSTTVGGVIGRQKALYTKQADGFDRDAEQKLAKIFADILNVAVTTDSISGNPSDAGASLTDIGTVLDRARNGIGIP